MGDQGSDEGSGRILGTVCRVFMDRAEIKTGTLIHEVLEIRWNRSNW